MKTLIWWAQNCFMRSVQVYREPGLWWVRVFGFGVAGKDTRRHPLLFSERHGYTRTVRLGAWLFKWLGRIRIMPVNMDGQRVYTGGEFTDAQ